MLSAVSFLVAMPDCSKAMRSSTPIISLVSAPAQSYTGFFLSALSVHLKRSSMSLFIHCVSSPSLWPNQHTSYSCPFLPLRRERSMPTWPGFLSTSSSSSSVRSRWLEARPSRSMPPAKRHSM